MQNAVDRLSHRRERIQLEDGILVTNRCVYDGWLVKAVLNGRNETMETYTHGPDLSGSLEGAGGIGGILAERSNGTMRWYHADVMGNINLMSTASRTLSARLTYDPFGQVLEQTGPTPRYQFSSKEWDRAAGVNYYGYRFYSPGQGRWLNRDPLEELAAQIHLYAFVLNDPIGLVDKHGLATCSPHIRASISFDFNSWKLDVGDCRFNLQWFGRRLGVGVAECDVEGTVGYQATLSCIKVDKCCDETRKSGFIDGEMSKAAVVGFGFRIRNKAWDVLRYIRMLVRGQRVVSELEKAMQAAIIARYSADELCAQAFP